MSDHAWGTFGTQNYRALLKTARGNVCPIYASSFTSPHVLNTNCLMPGCVPSGRVGSVKPPSFPCQGLSHCRIVESVSVTRAGGWETRHGLPWHWHCGSVRLQGNSAGLVRDSLQTTPHPNTHTDTGCTKDLTTWIP